MKCLILGDVFIYNVKATLTHKSKNLPYGTIITALVEAAWVVVSNEKGCEVESFFEKMNLAEIKYQRDKDANTLNLADIADKFA